MLHEYIRQRLHLNSNILYMCTQWCHNATFLSNCKKIEIEMDVNIDIKC